MAGAAMSRTLVVNEAGWVVVRPGRRKVLLRRTLKRQFTHNRFGISTRPSSGPAPCHGDICAMSLTDLTQIVLSSSTLLRK